MTQALKTILKDNPELLTEVESYESSATENATLLQEKERDLTKAINKREALKELIRKTTGVTDLTEETLSKFGSGDEALKSEVSALQEKLGLVTTERDGLTSKHKLEINTMRMADTLRSMGVDSEVWNDQAFKAVADEMLKGAEYDNGAFIYKAEDGATVFGENGKALTVQERVSQLKSDTNMYQFKPVQGGGAGGGRDTAPRGSNKTSDSDVADYYRKHGSLPEGYGKTA